VGQKLGSFHFEFEGLKTLPKKTLLATLSALMHSVQAGAALIHFVQCLMCDRRNLGLRSLGHVTVPNAETQK
jgi:hypothetical protein